MSSASAPSAMRRALESVRHRELGEARHRRAGRDFRAWRDREARLVLGPLGIDGSFLLVSGASVGCPGGERRVAARGPGANHGALGPLRRLRWRSARGASGLAMTAPPPAARRALG